jgi:cobaltochelatase CobN
VNGNLFITIQPPRGYFEHQDAMLHDLYLTPPHHYLAYYRWISHVFKARAVIHVGKHGSLEWLPGKAFGLSKNCFPDLAIMDLPNIYPYIINDPSEGTQAKRRSYCAIVDHLTPVFTNADLYDEMGDVERLLAEVQEASRQDPGKVPVLRGMLWDAVKAADLQKDLGLTEEMLERCPDKFLGEVHKYLSELSDNMINDGLHTLGMPPDGEGLIETIVQLTRHANGDVPSLREAVIEAMGIDMDTVLAHRGEAFFGSGGLTGAEIIQRAHSTCLELVAFLHERGYAEEGVNEAVERLPGSNAHRVAASLAYICNSLVPRIRRTTDEMEAIVRALSGGFVSPGPSGAPTRGQADILPTGRNFYSVDPRTIPSEAAYNVGVSLGDKLLARYRDETGAYPQSVGMIVWGGNTMRSKGDDIGEILYLLGLRPEWQANGIVTGLSVIPIEALHRPRIDVVPRISGFFRDAFPGLVALIDRAVHMVAALEERHEANFIRANVETDEARYRRDGRSKEDAYALARLRVFGCPPGTYGAGVEELVESKKWEDQTDLADNYIRYSAHGYSRTSYGKTEPDAFRRLLSRMDATVKNEDSREYDMLFCTDFYNYYGGLIVAAKSVRGEAPKSYVGDSSDPRRVGLRSTGEEAKFVLRSRLLNPKWLEGMKRHGYKGAGDISKVMDIIIGWDATAEVMEDWMYDRVAKTYALDPKMQEWLRSVNPHALLNITEKLLETIKRGMWRADAETEEQLKRAYLEVEGDIEDTID